MGDIILGVCILIGLLIGWKAGALRQLAGIGAAAAGWYAARLGSLSLATWAAEKFNLTQAADGVLGGSGAFLSALSLDGLVSPLLRSISFLLIFLVVFWLVRRFVRALSDILHGSLIGKVDRLLGALIGGILALLIIGVLVFWLLPMLLAMPAAPEWLLRAQEILNSSVYILPYAELWATAFWGMLPFHLNAPSGLA